MKGGATFARGVDAGPFVWYMLGMPLATLFLDLDAYFASVEQQERPRLRGKPVAVAAVATDSTCCIAVSYEARGYGIKTGTAVGEARQL